MPGNVFSGAIIRSNGQSYFKGWVVGLNTCSSYKQLHILDGHPINYVRVTRLVILEAGTSPESFREGIHCYGSQQALHVLSVGEPNVVGPLLYRTASLMARPSSFNG
jgi:hypothetical protein